MDCFVASAFARRRASADKSAPRNDGVRVVIQFKHQVHVRDLAAPCARGLRFVVPPNGGSRECRMHAAPAVSCAKAQKKAHTSIQGSGGNPTFPAQWLYDLYRAHPGVSGFAAPVASRNSALRPGWAFAPPKDLTPTIEASDPHDFAVRFSIARQARLVTAHGVYPALPSHRAHDAVASTTSHPAFRDDGQRPFLGDRMAGVLKVICPASKAKFCPSG
jgi:hypothetical protein